MGEPKRGEPRRIDFFLLTLGSAFAGLSCGGGDATAPETGSLEIITETSGPDQDDDGYTVLLGGTARGTIQASGSLVLDQLAPGDHQVGLSGLANNCQHHGENPRSVTVTAGGTSTANFTITCSAIPTTTGSIEITTVTNGSHPDPDGYGISLDGGGAQSIGINATLAISAVATGPHLIQLSGLTEQCTLEGSNPRQVTVAAGQKSTASFTVTCLASYRAIDLGTLGGSESKAYGINSKGHVVGSSQTAASEFRHAFLWQGNAMLNLDGPPVPFDESSSIAYGINSRGQVVGFYDVGDGDPLAIIWDAGGFTYLPGLGGIEENATAYAINEAGQVVGDDLSGESEHGSGLHAFFWDDGVNIDLGTLGAFGESTAYGVNSAGHVVGFSGHAFLWVNEIFTDLGTLGGRRSTAYSINDGEQVVGGSRTSGPREGGLEHAFIWENGKMTDLGTLGGDYSVAYGINATTQVVGTSNNSAGGPEHAFLWEKGVMTDLGTLGGAQSTARALNDRGQIVGWSETTGGEIHATLWVRD